MDDKAAPRGAAGVRLRPAPIPAHQREGTTVPKKTHANLMLRRDHLVDIILPIVMEKIGVHRLLNPDEAPYIRTRMADVSVALAQAVVDFEDERSIT